MSQSNFEGGISTLIPSKFSGISIKLSLFAVLTIFLILSKYI